MQFYYIVTIKKQLQKHFDLFTLSDIRLHFLTSANINAKTTGEMQSPIHYAAKFDATKALKVLIDWQADVNDRDYKGRTPLFVAAETGKTGAFIIYLSWLSFIQHFYHLYRGICI